jgi:hypothetical protein
MMTLEGPSQTEIEQCVNQQGAGPYFIPLSEFEMRSRIIGSTLFVLNRSPSGAPIEHPLVRVMADGTFVQVMDNASAVSSYVLRGNCICAGHGFGCIELFRHKSSGDYFASSKGSLFAVEIRK